MTTKYLKFSSLLAFSFASVFLNVDAFAWKIDSQQSSVTFISIKKTNIGELHHFTDISGSIDGSVATITISPDSVDTKVPIRNERIREFLFQTEIYPTIEIKSNVEKYLITETSDELAIPASLKMLGVSKELILNVRVNKVGSSTLLVTSTKPLIIRSSEFGMDKGIRKLSELVNNLPIAEAVPVTFALVFTKK